MEGSRLRLPEASQTPPGAAGSAPPSFYSKEGFQQNPKLRCVPSGMDGQLGSNRSRRVDSEIPACLHFFPVYFRSQDHGIHLRNQFLSKSISH
jgi:hypothetical protein